MHNCSRGKQHIEISRFRFRFRRTAHFLGHAKLTRLRQYAPRFFCGISSCSPYICAIIVFCFKNFGIALWVFIRVLCHESPGANLPG